MDEVVEAVEKTKQEWDEAYAKTQIHIRSKTEEYHKSGASVEGPSTQETNSLPRLNGLAQDGLAMLQSLEFKLDLLAPRLPADDQVKSARNRCSNPGRNSLTEKIAFGRWRRVHSTQAKSSVCNSSLRWPIE
ncbi:unnamed protein product [Linum tenue]|uniref:Uncharacterized protein n=1 Tax=Linum tenue TaxID=586396 RepID=A0AAV0HDI4_9ROSI|nr:unnamed protein product [Linum tenue]